MPPMRSANQPPRTRVADAGERGQDGEAAGLDLGYVELRVVEGWQESGEAEEAAKGNDVDRD